ncbi:MAG: isoprenylcysteine carboxylmethyltransferase family protein [Caulobacter sp.]|nr:isoprenylcysteine carboxylmethyltransferase family protein [Caulobacter sp.]
MNRTGAILGSILFFVLVPGTFAGVIPWWITRWDLSYSSTVLMTVGGLLILAGLAALIASFARFALDGLGTPAPIAPPGTLVVTGLYRFVRNPMYAAVMAIVLGQALMFYSPGLVAYAVAVWLAFQGFILMYEEPTLRVTFGDPYAAYFAAVPRWIPKLTPWSPEPPENAAP